MPAFLSFRTLIPLWQAQGVNTVEEKLLALGIQLPDAPAPMANYVPAVRSGNLLFLSGQGPRTAPNQFKTGLVGDTVTLEEAYTHARLVGIQLLAAAKQALDGDLSRVRRVVKLLGFVNSTPQFGRQPQVINGCSDLFVEVFGDPGRHARSALGAMLPNHITVEIEAIFEITDPL